MHVPSLPIRVMSAAVLFDGHDPAINIMRRILQSQGAEVIQLGHDRSVDEIAVVAIQEDFDSTRVCSLGRITDAFFEVGGQYRRNV